MKITAAHSDKSTAESLAPDEQSPRGTGEIELTFIGDDAHHLL